MNTEIANNGLEVYTHRLYELADEFIEAELEGEEKHLKERFREMLFYISDRIEKPNNADIQSLDDLFEAYVRLCARFYKLPTIEAFSWLVKIDRNTFTDWKEERYRNIEYYTVDGELIENIGVWKINHPNEEYREMPSAAHSDTAKKWFETCKGFTIDELSNAKFANPNLIFAAKAVYGLRETSPIPVLDESSRKILTAAELPKLKDFSE